MLRAALLLPVLFLSACQSSTTTLRAPPQPGDPRTNAVVAQACRQQVATQMQRQDRSQLMREDEAQSRLGATFAAQPGPSVSDGLGRQWQFDRRIDECIRANTQPAAPAAAAAPDATTPPPPAPPSRRSGR